MALIIAAAVCPTATTSHTARVPAVAAGLEPNGALAEKRNHLLMSSSDPRRHADPPPSEITTQAEPKFATIHGQTGASSVQVITLNLQSVDGSPAGTEHAGWVTAGLGVAGALIRQRALRRGAMACEAAASPGKFVLDVGRAIT